MYQPTPVPSDNRSLRSYLAQEFRRIAGALGGVSGVILPKLPAAPARVIDGMIVYADGVNWNPGSGEGFYGRQAGAWVKL